MLESLLAAQSTSSKDLEMSIVAQWSKMCRRKPVQPSFGFDNPHVNSSISAAVIATSKPAQPVLARSQVSHTG